MLQLAFAFFLAIAIALCFKAFMGEDDISSTWEPPDDDEEDE